MIEGGTFKSEIEFQMNLQIREGNTPELEVEFEYKRVDDSTCKLQMREGEIIELVHKRADYFTFSSGHR